ncbi:hypothetical protein SBRY_80064 [Actinacidiphila bryophytorum]|uniref:Uncharacterized protein n=1 Tax=Actinacidiphila bryophytorum TaxID=1436133 RepID=A0A9W4H7U8_9ACTN|nr:hypothetical protein SBRY_80064 [Actinacidiphila bryophytorum]
MGRRLHRIGHRDQHRHHRDLRLEGRLDLGRQPAGDLRLERHHHPDRLVGQRGEPVLQRDDRTRRLDQLRLPGHLVRLGRHADADLHRQLTAAPSPPRYDAGGLPSRGSAGGRVKDIVQTPRHTDRSVLASGHTPSLHPVFPYLQEEPHVRHTDVVRRQQTGTTGRGWRRPHTAAAALPPRSGRLPGHRPADGVSGHRGGHHGRALLHALHPVRGRHVDHHPLRHDLPLLRVGLGDRQRRRRLRLARRRARRPMGPGQHGGLRPADRLAAGLLRTAERRQQGRLPGALRTGQHRRGHRAGRHARTDQGLLTAARPGHGDGRLDDGAGGRQPGRHHRHQPDPGHLQLAGRTALLRPVGPGGLRRGDRRPARAVPAAPRPDHGHPAGPRPGRGPSQGHRPAGRPACRMAADAAAGHRGLRPGHRPLPAAVLRRRRQLRRLLRHHLRLQRAARQRGRQLVLGRQRHRAGRGRPAVRPAQGAQALHGRRGGRLHRDDGGLRHQGDPPDHRLLHLRLALRRHRRLQRGGLRPVDGGLHRDGREAQPGRHGDGPGGVGLDDTDRGRGLRGLHPGARHLGDPARRPRAAGHGGAGAGGARAGDRRRPPGHLRGAGQVPGGQGARRRHRPRRPGGRPGRPRDRPEGRAAAGGAAEVRDEGPEGRARRPLTVAHLVVDLRRRPGPLPALRLPDGRALEPPQSP